MRLLSASFESINFPRSIRKLIPVFTNLVASIFFEMASWGGIIFEMASGGSPPPQQKPRSSIVAH